MPQDAAQLGQAQTMEVLRRLLNERFNAELAEGVSEDTPLFSVGAGLSSLEGVEFLCEVEKEFGIEIKDLEWWVYETPTLSAVAHHVIELTVEQRAHAR